MLPTPVAPNMNIMVVFAIARPAPTADITIQHNPDNIVAKFHTQVYNATLVMHVSGHVRMIINPQNAAPDIIRPVQLISIVTATPAKLTVPATSALPAPGLARLATNLQNVVPATIRAVQKRSTVTATPAKLTAIATSVRPAPGLARMTNTTTVARVAAITLPAPAQKRFVKKKPAKLVRVAAMSATPEKPAPGSARIILTLRRQTATI